MLVPEAEFAPEMPAPFVPDQLKVVPDVVLLKVTAAAEPEQMVDVKGDAVTSGVGFTVMITVTGLPGQLLAVGMIEYVTVPAEVPDADNACTMLDPDPAVAPVAPLCVTVQLKVVPGKLPVSEILVVAPEQMVCAVGDAVAVGTGFTVTGMVSVLPGHPPDVEVTV